MDEIKTIEQIIKSVIHIKCQVEKYFSRTLNKYGISYHQANLLIIIAKNDGLTLGQLSKIANISLPNCSLITSRLEKLGLVKREKSENDQRFLKIKLTDKAIKMTSDVEREIVIMYKEAVSKLNAEERKTIVNGLYLLDKALAFEEKL